MSPKNLKQIYDECVSAAKCSIPIIVQNGNLHRWKGCVTSFVVAKIEFNCIPNFGLIIKDESHSIPCLILNPLTTVPNLMTFYNKTVIVQDLEFVVEVVVTNSKEYCLIHAVIEAEKINVYEKRLNVIKISKKSQSQVPNKSSSGPYNYERRMIMTPLKISSIILTLKSELFCLVLSLLFHPDSLENKELVWLVLKNNQVIWKELLLPNRNYNIHFSQDISYDYFKNFSSLLMLVDKNFDLSFQQILHHKELMKTNAVIFLPPQSLISSNFELHKDIVPEKWFGILAEELQTLKFASVFGVIKNIEYIESWKSLKCPWCDPDAFSCKEETHNSFETKRSVNYSWTEKLICQETKQKDGEWFPVVEFEVPKNQKISGFGIRGGKINVQIAMEDIHSQEVFYIFLKRWQMEQYPAGLMIGNTLCFTDLNIKRSKKKNLYFVNTPITRVVYLSNKNDSNVSNNWGKFGFPYFNFLAGEKIWGIIELDFLAKVSISTKCKICGQLYLKYCCPNFFCPNNKRKIDASQCDVTASARLFVRGIEGSEANSLYMKNDDVKKYLGFPDRIWKKLSRLSALSELNYSYQGDDSEDFENTEYLPAFFHFYCKYFRPKRRFHVCCRRFKGNDRKYFCVYLEEVGSYRLAFSRSVLDTKSEEEVPQN